jgi:hypothetical protein
MPDLDRELAHDIGYALAQSPYKVKSQRIEALRYVAADVVAHLRLAGWMFHLRPPQPMHGPSGATAPHLGAAPTAPDEYGASDDVTPAPPCGNRV